MVAAGSVSDFDGETQARLTSSMATTLGVDASAVSLSITAASVKLVFTVAVADATEAASVAGTVATALDTTDAASVALSDPCLGCLGGENALFVNIMISCQAASL